MKLKSSTEPLRAIAVAVTVVIAAVGVGLASIVGVVDWPWLGPTSVAIAAAVGVIGHWLGVEIGRPAVWSTPNHDAEMVEVVETIAAGQAAENDDVESVLAEAAEAAGM